MKTRLLKASVVALSLSLAACSSSDDSTSTDENTPVTGEFHIIQPTEVDDYIANFEAQRGRNAFTFDGVSHDLSFEGEDSEENVLVTAYPDHLLIIGFDIANEEPLPTLVLVQIENEQIVNQWAGEGLSVEESAEGDFVYSGRLGDTSSDAEFETTLVFNESLITAGSSTLTVDGTDAFLNGDMGTGTYVQMRDMIAANPGVTRLVIQQSSGSVNDAINVHTGRLIRGANLATYVPADGDINSGAVDLFTAGVTRTVEQGGILGVHSWCCEDGVTADMLPRNSPAHGTQLTYFREMLPETGEDFYFFTLDAAAFDDIHPMTREEMTLYTVVTE